MTVNTRSARPCACGSLRKAARESSTARPLRWRSRAAHAVGCPASDTADPGDSTDGRREGLGGVERRAVRLPNVRQGPTTPATTEGCTFPPLRAPMLAARALCRSPTRATCRCAPDGPAPPGASGPSFASRRFAAPARGIRPHRVAAPSPRIRRPARLAGPGPRRAGTLHRPAGTRPGPDTRCRGRAARSPHTGTRATAATMASSPAAHSDRPARAPWYAWEKRSPCRRHLQPYAQPLHEHTRCPPAHRTPESALEGPIRHLLPRSFDFHPHWRAAPGPWAFQSATRRPAPGPDAPTGRAPSSALRPAARNLSRPLRQVGDSRRVVPAAGNHSFTERLFGSAPAFGALPPTPAGGAATPLHPGVPAGRDAGPRISPASRPAGCPGPRRVG